MTPQEIFELIGNLLIYAGAISVTFFPRQSLKPHIFFFFLFGHIMWSIAGFVFYDPWHWRIVMLNGGFVFIDCFAIYKRIGLTEKMGIKDGNS